MKKESSTLTSHVRYTTKHRNMTKSGRATGNKYYGRFNKNMAINMKEIITRKLYKKQDRSNLYERSFILLYFFSLSRSSEKNYFLTLSTFSLI